MNEKFKNIFLISLLTGGIFGVITLIPFIGILSLIILLVLISVPLIYLFEKKGLIDKSDEKEILKYGALIGIFSTMGFGIIFYPLVYIFSSFFNFGGLGVMIKLMSLPLALMFIIFICLISAIFNSFSALMYYYVKESIKNLK